MNDFDLDERGRRASTALRDAVIARSDPDAALSELLAASDREPTARATHRRRYLVGAVAAATIVGLVVTLSVWPYGEGAAPSASTDAPTVPPTTDESIVPSVLPTSPTSTEAPATTSTSPVTSSTTTPPTIAPLASPTISHLDPPPAYEPTAFARLDPGSHVYIAMGDGYAVIGSVLDDRGALIIVPTDGSAPTTIRVARVPWNFVVGPGPVVYGEVYVPSDDPAAPHPTTEFVVIALEGMRAGEELLTLPSLPHAADPWGPFYAHSPEGIVDRWHGDVLVTPYVDATGEPMQVGGAVFELAGLEQVDPSQSRQTPMPYEMTRGDETWRFTIDRHPEAPAVDYTEGVAAPGGAGLFSTSIGPRLDGDPDYGTPSTWIAGVLQPGGEQDWYTMPDGWHVEDSNEWGTLLTRFSDAGVELAMFDPSTSAVGVPETTTTPAAGDLLLTVADAPPGALLGDDSACDLGTEGLAQGWRDLLDDAAAAGVSVSACRNQLEWESGFVNSVAVVVGDPQLAERAATPEMIGGLIDYFGLDCCSPLPNRALPEIGVPADVWPLVEGGIGASLDGGSLALRAWRDGNMIGIVTAHVDGAADAEADRLALVQHERMLVAAG